jgi:enoyl-[acyl-carrier protein] reductase I
MQSADNSADYCIVMFSDLIRKVTKQNLYNDGCFSGMGISQRAIKQYINGLDENHSENGNVIYG